MRFITKIMRYIIVIILSKKVPMLPMFCQKWVKLKILFFSLLKVFRDEQEEKICNLMVG